MAFYDHRGYRTIGGTVVPDRNPGDGSTNDALCGIGPPNPPATNLLTGADSSVGNFNLFGQSAGGNSNKACEVEEGSFGDTKTLDLWTYTPSEARGGRVVIVDSADYGDAPDTEVGNGPGNYSTLANDNGPLHGTSTTLFLGSGVTSETNGFVDGVDDSGNATDDADDAFTSLPNASVGSTYSLSNIPIKNTTGSDATLSAWIDFDQDGRFEESEYNSATIASDGSTASLSWNVPNSATVGTTYARFRLTTNSLSDDGNTADVDERSIGSASNGEVEDYRIAIANTPVNTSAFTCDSTLYIVFGNGGTSPFSQLNSINRSSNPFTFDPIGAQVNGYNYNALAYNPLDNYLYGIVEAASTSSPFPTGTILRIGNDGVPVSLGKPQGDALSISPNAGTFLADGTYVVSRQTSPVYTIDITTTPPTATDRGAVAGARFEDFATNPYDTTPNRVYGVEDNSDRLVYFDLDDTSNGVTPAISGGSTTINHNHGSQFYDVFGNLLYRSTSPQALYIVKPDGSATFLADTPSGGSHDGASCFAVGLSKDISDTQPIPVGQNVTYTYQIANASDTTMSVTLTDDLRSVSDYSGTTDDESGTPINGTYTGRVSTASGTVALSNSNQTITISDITLSPQSLTPVEVEVKVPSSATPDIYYNQATITGLPPGFVSLVQSDYPATALYEDPTPLSITEPLTSDPDVLLVKRITAINQGLFERERLFYTSYVDVAGDPNDNEPNWPGGTTPATIGGGTVESYIQGITGVDNMTAIAGTTVRPGDEIEYTILFLSNGSTAANNVLICDRIPQNTTFLPNAFNDLAGTGGDRGIRLAFSGGITSLTNADDGDEIAATNGDNNGIGGYYFPATVDPSAAFPGAGVNCGGPNDNGVIVVDLSDIPNATGDGTPGDSYGFIRFRVSVD